MVKHRSSGTSTNQYGFVKYLEKKSCRNVTNIVAVGESSHMYVISLSSDGSVIFRSSHFFFLTIS